MSNDIWKTEILKAIDESYDGSGGVYLDQGTNLLDELHTLTGNQANIVLPGAGNSVANQIRHLLTGAAGYQAQLANQPFPDLDWGADWQPTTLTDDAWAELIAQFAASRAGLKDSVTSSPLETAEIAATAVSLVTHLSYHIGQIRHAAGYVATIEGARS